MPVPVSKSSTRSPSTSQMPMRRAFGSGIDLLSDIQSLSPATSLIATVRTRQPRRAEDIPLEVRAAGARRIAVQDQHMATIGPVRYQRDPTWRQPGNGTVLELGVDQPSPYVSVPQGGTSARTPPGLGTGGVRLDPIVQSEGYRYCLLERITGASITWPVPVPVTLRKVAVGLKSKFTSVSASTVNSASVLIPVCATEGIVTW